MAHEDRNGKKVRAWYYDNSNDVYRNGAEKELAIAVDAMKDFL